MPRRPRTTTAFRDGVPLPRRHLCRGYPPRFKLSLAAKDMRLALGAAAEAGRDLKTAEAVSRWLDEAAVDRD
jgi:3-hydroxyisobutyrate dehydrogenase-like beta-hydroxyacid dehydrogenase